MNNRLGVSDISFSEMHRIRTEFENDVRIRQLRCKQKLAEMQHNYFLAMQIGKEIEDVFTSVLANLLQDAEQSVEIVELNFKNFPQADRGEMMEIIVTLFMSCDIIETAVMDFNDILHRQDSSLQFELFDEILELKNKAKAKLDYFRKNSSYMKGLYWADRCDDMYKMLRNKAGSVIRRSAEEKKKGGEK